MIIEANTLKTTNFTLRRTCKLKVKMILMVYLQTVARARHKELWTANIVSVAAAASTAVPALLLATACHSHVVALAHV